MRSWFLTRLALGHGQEAQARVAVRAWASTITSSSSSASTCWPRAAAQNRASARGSWQSIASW